MHTIMVVEDEPNQRSLFQMDLEDAGYHVLTAPNGQEALQTAQEEHPDLVVLDLGLPGMDGIDLLSRLLGLNANLPVIIYSGYQRFKENFMTWAADGYLIKSSDLEGLKTKIRSVLSERKTRGSWPIWRC